MQWVQVPQVESVWSPRFFSDLELLVRTQTSGKKSERRDNFTECRSPVRTCLGSRSQQKVGLRRRTLGVGLPKLLKPRPPVCPYGIDLAQEWT